MDLKINLASTESAVPIIDNIVPDFPSDKRLAIIGDYPSQDDIANGAPFSDYSGFRLTNTITQMGLVGTNHILLGNLVNRPDVVVGANKRQAGYLPSGAALTSGLSKLSSDIYRFNPHCVLLLGEIAFKFAGVDSHTLWNYRGSMFKCGNTRAPFFGRKCIATFHPRDVNTKLYNKGFIFNRDIQLALEECMDSELTVPKYDFELYLTVDDLLERFKQIRKDKTKISLDIEGVHPNITCVGICTTPRKGFIVPFHEIPLADRPKIYRGLAEVLEDPEVEKILQNGIYDSTQLAKSFNIIIRNLRHDTMFSGWELMPELPKGLGTQVSLYTRQPYYKEGRSAENRNEHFTYCCTDAAVTYELQETHEGILDKEQKKHYEFLMHCLSPLRYIASRGIKYATELAADQRAKFVLKCNEIETRTNARVRAKTGNPTYTINLGSPKQVCELLYGIYKLPKKHPKKKDGYGLDKTKVTSDEEAVLELFMEFNEPILTDILAWRSAEKRRQFCSLGIDADNRMRSAYSLVGTKTGRISASKTFENTGTNLQTITEELRSQYIADEDHWFFQTDAAGADGWTVAAYAAANGDPTMLEDYLYGLKPAKIIALMFKEGAAINKLSRAELKERTSHIDEKGTDGWLYFASKRVQHATSYDAHYKRVIKTILKDSYKKGGNPITVSRQHVEQLQALFQDVRYPGVKSYKNHIRSLIKNVRGYPVLTAANGHTRTFLDRTQSDETVRQALAHLPQAHTTHVTNQAALNLWQDPSNRREDGSLIIEPLHQVHDAICGQFPRNCVEQSIQKIRQYTTTKLNIAGIDITIPFEGQYGPSWGELGSAYGGGDF